MKPQVVYVFATNEAGTRCALEAAAQKARTERARLELLVPHVRAHGLTLDRCGAEHDRLAELWQALVVASGVDAKVRVCCCREPQHMLGRLLVDSAPVVLGGPRGTFRRTPEEHLAETLARDGHDVTFTEVIDRVLRTQEAAATVHP